MIYFTKGDNYEEKSVFLTIVLISTALSVASHLMRNLNRFQLSITTTSKTITTKAACMLVNHSYTSLDLVQSLQTCIRPLDDTVPSGQVLIFNKDPGDDNMQEWKDNMESELERTLAHPFIHGPDLAESLEVVGIPTMFFVNSEET